VDSDENDNTTPQNISGKSPCGVSVHVNRSNRPVSLQTASLIKWWTQLDPITGRNNVYKRISLISYTEKKDI